MFEKNNIVQFTEEHEWKGCLGFIDEVEEKNGNVYYLVGVPIPTGKTAYIFTSGDHLTYIGEAILVPKEG